MPRGVEPVAQWKAEIVAVEFDESVAQRSRTAETSSKRVGFKLEMSTENCETELEKLQHTQQFIETDLLRARCTSLTKWLT